MRVASSQKPAQSAHWRRKWHEILSILIFFAFNVTTCEASVYDQSGLYGCYPCTHLMNREWRQDLSDKCSGTSQDCGNCLEGYEASKQEDKCFQKETINIVDRNYAIIQKGTTVILQCYFNDEVDCAWKRRGYVVEISNRYSYINGNGAGTKDCSIKIAPFNDNIDHGLFQCESMTDENGNPTIKANTITLYSGRVTTANPKNSKVFAELQETLIIPCYFNQIVHCAWNRKGIAVEIKGRHSYINAENGIGTKDCSIKSSALQENDFGLWECKANSSTFLISSTTVQLLRVDVRHPAIVAGPTTTQALIGDRVRLSCIFDADVACIWQHNEREGTRNSRFNFVTNNANARKKDCSIEILNFVKEDVGNWTCMYEGSMHSSASTAMLNIAPKNRPSKPVITVIKPSGSNIHSAETITVEDDIIKCFSNGGNPAPELRWGMNQLNDVSNISKIRNQLDFDVEIFFNLYEHKDLFKEGLNILTCMASHPLLENDGQRIAVTQIVIPKESPTKIPGSPTKIPESETEIPDSLVSKIVIITFSIVITLICAVGVTLFLYKKFKKPRPQKNGQEIPLLSAHERRKKLCSEWFDSSLRAQYKKLCLLIEVGDIVQIDQHWDGGWAICIEGGTEPKVFLHKDSLRKLCQNFDDHQLTTDQSMFYEIALSEICKDCILRINNARDQVSKPKPVSEIVRCTRDVVEKSRPTWAISDSRKFVEMARYYENDLHNRLDENHCSQWFDMKDLETFLWLLKQGDIVQFKRTVLSHWAVYQSSKLAMMIYRCGSSSRPIDTSSIEEVIGGCKFRINNSEDKHHKPRPESQIDRIFNTDWQSMDDKKDNLNVNNCKMFAEYLRYGPDSLVSVSEDPGIEGNITIGDQRKDCVSFTNVVNKE